MSSVGKKEGKKGERSRAGVVPDKKIELITVVEGAIRVTS